MKMTKDEEKEMVNDLKKYRVTLEDTGDFHNEFKQERIADSEITYELLKKYMKLVNEEKGDTYIDRINDMWNGVYFLQKEEDILREIDSEIQKEA